MTYLFAMALGNNLSNNNICSALEIQKFNIEHDNFDELHIINYFTNVAFYYLIYKPCCGPCYNLKTLSVKENIKGLSIQSNIHRFCQSIHALNLNVTLWYTLSIWMKILQQQIFFYGEYTMLSSYTIEMKYFLVMMLLNLLLRY